MSVSRMCVESALALSLALSPGHPKAKDVQIEANSDSISKIVRSDTKAFFSYLKQRKVRALVKPYEKFEGVIQGDPHAGNVAPTLVQTLDGHFEIRMVTNDFDNVGVGSFVWEFIHNVVQAKAIEPNVSVKELLEAYLEGLDGKAMEMPKHLRNVVDMTYDEYRELRNAYVTKKVSAGKLKRKLGKVEDYNGPYTLTDVQEIFPEGKVVDFARRVESEGGNTGERLWILLQDRSGDLVIKELKDYQPSALSRVRKQPDMTEWSTLIHEALWPDLNPATYDLVRMKNGKVFWRREKAVTLLDVPRSSEKAEKEKFRKQIVLFDANFFGLSAASQGQGAAFAKAIRDDREGFVKMVKRVAHPYLKAASKAADKFAD